VQRVNSGQVGLVGHWNVVAFDEVGGMKVTDPDTIQIMKDYLANGRLSRRGGAQVQAEAFQPLAKEFDLAVIDLIRADSWESASFDDLEGGVSQSVPHPRRYGSKRALSYLSDYGEFSDLAGRNSGICDPMR
jgi:hypothetical protein